MFDGIDIVIIRVWDSIRIDRISSKFTHLERVRTEFSASKFEYSQESNRKPTEIDQNSPNSVETEFFPKLNPKTLVIMRDNTLGVTAYPLKKNLDPRFE